MEKYLDSNSIYHIINSLTLITIVLIVKSFMTNLVRKTKWGRDNKRKWYVGIRNFSSLTLIIGIVTIWATEIHTFALSIIALVGALIIAGKELFLCFLGGLLKSFNQYFRVGDRIEIDGIRGDVIDTNLMVTRILEIGPKNFTHQMTGRSITLPNSLFLTKSLINETFLELYVLHVFKIAFPRSANWKKAEKCMIEAANKICRNFIEPTDKMLRHLHSKEGLDLPKAQPRITYQMGSSTQIEMIIRIPAPSTKKGTVEQEIIKEFLETFYPPAAAKDPENRLL